MKPVFKILLISFLIIALLITAAGAYLINNKKILTAFVLEQINKNLTAELQIEGSDVTIFKNFPNVSLDLIGVSINQSNKTLFKANHVYLGFNIEDIINKKYHIQVIKIDSGLANLAIDENGISNFDIVKKTDTTGSSNDTTQFLLELARVDIDNFELKFQNRQSKQITHCFIHEADFKGKLSADVFELQISSKAMVYKISNDGLNFIKDKNTEIDARINIDNTKKTYAFTDARLKIDELDLSLNGRLKETEKGNDIKMDFNAKKISITSLLSILPIKLPAEVLVYKTSGNVYFKGGINGVISATGMPAIHASFGISNGKLNNEKLNIALNNISLLGEFSNGTKHTMETSTLTLKNIKAQLLSDQLSGDIIINNLSKPQLDLSLNGNLNLENVFKLFPNKSIEKINGSVSFDSKIKANLQETDASRIWKQAGNYGKFDLTLNELKLTGLDKTISNLKANFALNGANLQVENCSLNLNQTDVSIKGNLINFLGYLFTANETLNAEISYKSNYVDMAHVVFLPTNKAKEKTTTTAATKYNLPKNIKLTLTASINQLKYNKFTASNVETKLQILPMQIIIENTRFNAFNGALSLQAKIVNSTQGNYFINSKIDLKNINLTEAFKQCDDFGQNNITYQNISGTYSGSIDLASVWDENLNCKKDKILAFVKVQIKNGQLINYKPLEALSKYISLSDLQNLKFADLNNTLEIKDQTIVIPKMQIDNNALNITLSGSQNFDNFLDYDLKLNLTELLKKKLKPKDNAFGEEDEKTKGINLFMHMRGPIDNLKFTYNKADVKTNIKENLKKEGQTIMELIRKEVGATEKKSNDKPKEKSNDNDELEFEKE